MVSTPKHWLPNFHQTGAPLCPPEVASWGALRPGKGVSTFCSQSSPSGPFP